MSRNRKVVNLLHALGVTFVDVNALLGNEASLGCVFRTKINTDILRRVKKRSTLVIVGIFDMQS